MHEKSGCVKQDARLFLAIMRLEAIHGMEGQCHWPRSVEASGQARSRSGSRGLANGFRDWTCGRGCHDDPYRPQSEGPRPGLDRWRFVQHARRTAGKRILLPPPYPSNLDFLDGLGLVSAGWQVNPANLPDAYTAEVRRDRCRIAPQCAALIAPRLRSGRTPIAT